MWEKLRVVFTIEELRKKILLTLGLLAIYRVGWQIQLPVIDQAALAERSDAGGGFADFINQVSVFSASDLSQATIFGLGIMPYISASIIFQLLGTVWKPIEDLRKEGETGRKKINEYTRYLTVEHRAVWGQQAGPDRLTIPGAERGRHVIDDLFLDLRCRRDHDLRYDLPDVARRANRRIRHW